MRARRKYMEHRQHKVVGESLEREGIEVEGQAIGRKPVGTGYCRQCRSVRSQAIAGQGALHVDITLAFTASCRHALLVKRDVSEWRHICSRRRPVDDVSASSRTPHPPAPPPGHSKRDAGQPR
jgi:hypothetical protein